MKTNLLYACALSALIYSCEKQEITSNGSAPNASNKAKIEQSNKLDKAPEIIGDYDENMANCVDNDSVNYYLDNELVEPGTFNPASEDLFLLIDGDGEDTDGDGEEELIEVRIRAFTTLDGYLAFGDANEIPLREMEMLEEELAAYFEETGLIDMYGETADNSDEEIDVPAEYMDYQYDLIERYFPGALDDRTPINLFKDYVGGSSWIHSGYNPWLMPGYNNRVSRYFYFGLYGMVNFYDRSFFRRRMATVWGWGWSNVWLHNAWGLGFLNDRTTSLIAI